MGQTQTRKQKILGDVKKARRQRIIISTVIITILAIGIVAGVILFTRPPPQDPHIGAPISTQMYDYLSGVSNTTLTKVNTGASQGVYPMTPISGAPPLMVGNRPEFLYVGADYCPYCAAERWSIIVALSKFGTFTGLTYMESSATDVYADTPTFSFWNPQTGSVANYTSQYIAFVSVETTDRNQNPLQTLSSDQKTLINNYDCYQGTCGGLAFIDIANQWEMGTASHAGSQFLPNILDGVGNWTTIGSLLNNPTTAVAQAVDGAANYLISAICSVDGQQGPNGICSHTVTQAPLDTTNAPISNTFNMITAGDVRTDDSSWRSFPSLTW